MPADLLRLARDFAGTVQRLLNTTVCEGVRIPAVVSQDPNVILVGYGLRNTSLVTEPFPVHLGRRKPQCWLDVSFRLCLDDAGRYLAAVASFFGIYANDDEHSCLCHFDYEREKPGGYPEAHLQVYGDSAALAAWGGQPQTRQLDRLHFPVGGRRGCDPVRGERGGEASEGHVMAEYGRIEDVSGGIDGTGGGQIRADSGGGIPALPGDAASVTVTSWPPASWGPRLYEIDTSGNRVAVTAPGS